MRPPKPAKNLEYVLSVRRDLNEDTGDVTIVLTVATTREFESFQYALHLETALNEALSTITVQIGGVTVPPDLMPGAGPANGSHGFRNLKPGTYTVVLLKNPKLRSEFQLVVSKTTATLQPLPDRPAETEFVQLRSPDSDREG